MKNMVLRNKSVGVIVPNMVTYTSCNEQVLQKLHTKLLTLHMRTVVRKRRINIAM